MFGKRSVEQIKEKDKRKSEENEWAWDKKRLIIAGIIIFILAILLFESKEFISKGNEKILGENSEVEEVEKPEFNTPDVDIKTNIGSAIEDVSKNINSLSPKEIATSSPQIQKVLEDIQQIKNLPANKAKDACYRVCSSL